MDNSARLDDRSTVRALSLSRLGEDHPALERTFPRLQNEPVSKVTGWIARACEPDAVAVVDASPTPLGIGDADRVAGGWQQMALKLRCAPEAPCLILASSVVDDRLGAEALQEGVCDVLAKPFCAAEVLRILKWPDWVGSISTS